MDTEHVARFAYEAGQLKRTPRSGWLLAGVPNPESVAEHSYRVGVLAYLIAVGESANADRAATLGLFHDLPETRIGDVPSVGKQYVSTTDPRQVVTDQVAALPGELAERITALVSEHESAKEPGASIEARCSRDADKVECLLQAREYQAQTGNGQLAPWVESMTRVVATPTGKALAQAALDVAPGEWFQTFAEAVNPNLSSQE